MAVDFKGADLYGGAIKVDLPTGFTDASKLRQIPDNQEVYVQNDGLCSVIIELLEYQPVANEDAPAYFFTDLAETNEAIEHAIEDVSICDANDFNIGKSFLREGMFVATITGTQHMYKWGKMKASPDAKPDTVHIYMALIRIPAVTTDILLTINVPQAVADAEEAATGCPPPPTVAAWLRRMLESISVVDPSLFGAEASSS